MMNLKQSNNASRTARRRSRAEILEVRAQRRVRLARSIIRPSLSLDEKISIKGALSRRYGVPAGLLVGLTQSEALYAWHRCTGAAIQRFPLYI